MVFLPACFFFIFLTTQCMENIFIEENNKDLHSLFSNLFPGKDDKANITPQKIVLPLEKIAIEEKIVPRLVQSRSIVQQEIQERIKFITSSLAQKKNLEIITPFMLIFGKPGMGKSTLALSIAQLMQKLAGWTIYKLESTDLANQFQNSGPQNLKAIAEKLLHRKKGSILIVEDMNGFYLQYQSGDTNDSGSNAIAWWQFLDQMKNNPQKHVLILATESNTDMPNQIKERLGHTMIVKTVTQYQIQEYLKFELEQQSFVLGSCEHYPSSIDKPNNRAVKTDSHWLVPYQNCTPCMLDQFLKENAQELSVLPDISYRMLDRIMQQAMRASGAFAFKMCIPYSFILPELITLIKKQSEKTEHILLKMDQEYESEQERLHKKQMAQQKQFHEEQQGLTLLQSHYAYNQVMQQLIFSSALDNGGMPGSIEAKPKELLDDEQYQLYENTYVKNVSNTTPVFPSELNSKENNIIMEKTLKKFKEIHHDNNK